MKPTDGCCFEEIKKGVGAVYCANPLLMGAVYAIAARGLPSHPSGGHGGYCRGIAEHPAWCGKMR